MKKLLKKESGFTLIELMIVIAIIGVLAAIAIPNFISYRDKSFCSGTESDAQSIASAIANYFSNPGNKTVQKSSISSNVKVSNGNTWDLSSTGSGDTYRVQITVSDGSSRCKRTGSGWNGSGTYTTGI